MQFVTVHPFDPWGSKVGGVETFIRLMLRHAPSDARLALVGVSEAPAQRPLHHWMELELEGRAIHFYAVDADETPNRRGWIPLFLRFPLHLLMCRISMPDAFTPNAIAIYHRPEPAACNAIQTLANALFVHADPREWVSAHSEVKWRYAPWLYRWVEARAMRQAERVHCVNRSAVETLHDRYPSKAEAITFTPTTYRDELFYPPTPEEKQALRQRLLPIHGVELTAPVIIFSGRLERQKNPLLALEAFSLLRNRRPAHLVMIGDGALRIEMEQAVDRMGLRESVTMLGAQPPEQVAEWLRAGDLFLLTSSYEGMPIALLEAQASGAPAVATNTGEVRNVIQEGKSGRVVNKPTAEALTLAMEVTLTRDAYRNPEACAEAVARFRPQIVFAKLYENLTDWGSQA